MSAAGAVRFARYAYPPNELGYCGPPGAAALLSPETTGEVERRARLFDGAWSYLELLAEHAGTDDPLDEAVVEAYWVGGPLLDAVSPRALVERLTDRFRGQVGGTWQAAEARASAHHAFQVFEVYPWLGLLREGRPPGPAVQVLDRCRIRVGTVRAVDGEQVSVTCRPLTWDGAALRQGRPAVEQARWSVAGSALIDVPMRGDIVALHWDWVCESLSPEQAATIEDRETRTLAAVLR